METNHYDKPTIENTACLLLPIKGGADLEADILRKQIKSSKDSVPSCKRVWYVSNNGDDNASGDSPDTPWLTIQAHTDKLEYGDAVLFERGGVFRGGISCVSGVFYGAYGSGDKPCIYVSRMNYAKADWEKVSENLWRTEIEENSDIGIMVFNHGEALGFKKKTLDDVKNHLDFYCEGNYVWLCHNQLPAEAWKSIEMGDLVHIFYMGSGTHDVTIENITMKYGGGMAVQGSDNVKNITVRNCEIGWIGGSYLPNYKDGKVRYGNGIEFWKGCENILVENCWIYQIYDSGLSHQGHGDFVQKDIIFRNNLVEYTSFASIEYWTNDQNRNRMENIVYANNILRFAGYAWGEAQRPDHPGYHILSTGKMDHKCTNFQITGNIMDVSARALIRCTSAVGTLPEISGNTYIQNKGGLLGAYGDVEMPNLSFDDDAKDTLANVFGDNQATVIFI